MNATLTRAVVGGAALQAWVGAGRAMEQKTFNLGNGARWYLDFSLMRQIRCAAARRDCPRTCRDAALLPPCPTPHRPAPPRPPPPATYGWWTGQRCGPTLRS